MTTTWRVLPKTQDELDAMLREQTAALRALVDDVPIDHTCHERRDCRGCDWIQRRDALLAGEMKV